MGIQLLSVNHRVAPLFVRSLFAFDEEQQLQIMMRLREDERVQETIIINTCNRIEVYVYSDYEECSRELFEWIELVILEEATATKIENMGDYMLLYQGEKAIHHLFKVAAGLDSMVLGEDQILGQVKRAHDYAHQHGMCSTYLNTLFRFAVTSAKKIKTDTELSKTPISTASISLKAAQDYLGTLVGKKIMLIGATGKIGGIVLKNAQCLEGVEVFTTVRTHSLVNESNHNKNYHVVPYEERYHYMKDMDVVISATTSPHYTITKHHLKESIKTNKKRVFIDLAVPMDIESGVGEMEGVVYYNIEDFKRFAKENNSKKKKEAKAAGIILEDYETQFNKWLLFQQALPDINLVKEKIMKEIKEKGAQKALDHFFYDMREQGSGGELNSFFTMLKKCIE